MEEVSSSTAAASPALTLVMEGARITAHAIALCCNTNHHHSNHNDNDNNKENVDPLECGRTRRSSGSPLPSCCFYPRIPLQDITALFPSLQELEEGKLVLPPHYKPKLKPKSKPRNIKARYDLALVSFTRQHPRCCGRGEGAAVPSLNNKLYYFR